MLKIRKTIIRYVILFFALYLISAITIKIFMLFGVKYNNSSNVVFYGALLATIFIILLTKGIKKNKKSKFGG